VHSQKIIVKNIQLLIKIEQKLIIKEGLRKSNYKIITIKKTGDQ